MCAFSDKNITKLSLSLSLSCSLIRSCQAGQLNYSLFLGRVNPSGRGVTWKIFWQGCAAGTLKTPPIHIIFRLAKHTYSYNLHVKRDPIQIIEDY